MNSLGASILCALLVVTLFAPRRWALLGMMGGVLFLTESQQVNVAGFNMFAMRFLELAGFVRVMARREFSFHQLNKIDQALLALYFFVTIVFALRGEKGFAYVAGQAVDAFLCYFTFRGLSLEVEDLRWFLRAFVFLLAPYMLLVLMESRTGHNPFDALGGMNGGSEWMRHGRPRCFGSFRQPDTLGMFAASFIPLYIGMACITKGRIRALLAICVCLTIVWASNAGGPASALTTGLVCWCFWRFRKEMRKVRWGIVAAITGLALVMKAPVWYIFAHVSNVTGGDGWHRSYLIQVAYEHLNQWWFDGMSYMKTKHWFAYELAVTGGADITNQFISFGLCAGSGAIALFILLLTRAFSALGKAMSVVRSDPRQPNGDEFLLFGMGVMLVVHIIDWFGITYFDQMYVVWFMELAAISSVSAKILATEQLEFAASNEAADKCDDSEPLPVAIS